MMNCPKCGFHQPKDRFCASCGVDMQAYVPKQKSFLNRLLTNWILHLSVILILVGSLTLYIREKLISSKLNSQYDQPIRFKSSTLNKQNAKKELTTDSPTSEQDPKEVLSAQNTNENSNISVKAQDEALPTPNTQTNISKLAESLAGDSNIPSKIILTFAEMNRTQLNEMLSESRNITNFGNYFSAILLDKEDSRSNYTYAVLDKYSSESPKLNQPILVFKGTHDSQSDQNIGLNIQINPIQIDENGVQLQIDFKRNLKVSSRPGVGPGAGPGGPASLPEDVFQEQIHLKKDTKAFITGLLPHRILTDEEAQFFRNNSSILRILNNPDFQNGNLEFVLFFEAK